MEFKQGERRLVWAFKDWEKGWRWRGSKIKKGMGVRKKKGWGRWLRVAGCEEEE